MKEITKSKQISKNMSGKDKCTKIKWRKRVGDR